MIKGKKVLGVITARGGSVRLPRKNLLKIGKYTLLEHSIRQARKSKFIDTLICSTDDKEIRNNAIKNNCPVPFLRPKYLATNKAKTKDLLEHIVRKVDYHDYLVLIQPTSPLRTSEDIDNTLALCHKKNAYSTVSITQNIKDPKIVYSLNQEKIYKRFKFNKKDFFILNGAVYALRFKNILKRQSIINNNTLGYIMPFERSIDIDTALDYEIAKIIYKKKY